MNVVSPETSALLSLPFTQSWLSENEAGFQPGGAEFYWRHGVLYLEADLFDDEVSTCAAAHQQRLWELGDVVEFFVQRAGENGYYEYQIAPNGMTLALHYPDLTCVAALRSGARQLKEFLINLTSEAQAEQTKHGWKASLGLPLAGKTGDVIRVSSGRYDYRSGQAPIISCTSPHLVRDFHRPQEWREMRLH